MYLPPDLLGIERVSQLVLGSFLMLTGCSSETLNIQTDFPFTVTTQTLPASIRVGSQTAFEVGIVSERTTSLTAYTARWRNLSASPARLMLNGKLVIDNQPVSIPLKGNKAVFVPLDTAAKSYQFELNVVNQSGQSQTIPLSIQTIP